MKRLPILAVVLVLLGTGVCARLGFWQLSRLAEKRAANAAMRAALAAPPVELGAGAIRTGGLPPRDRRIAIRGTFDNARHVLLGSRVEGGLPGVVVVTPLLVAGDSIAVPVERGWLYASDATHARPQDSAESGERVVVGLAHPLERAPNSGWTRLPGDSTRLWSARTLDADSMRANWRDVGATFVLRELPGPDVPEKPLRSAPRPLDEMMHLSYAIQWFLFGTTLLVGSLFVARRRGRGPDPTLDIPPRP